MKALIAVASIIHLTTGCQTPIREINAALRDDIFILLPGVEGGAWQFTETVKGLKETGLTARIEIVEWGVRPFGSFANLSNLEANRERANQIAKQIIDLRKADSTRRIILAGYSGGGGLAVLIAERLDSPGVLDRLVLIGAAVSPWHDMAAAARSCTRGMSTSIAYEIR